MSHEFCVPGAPGGQTLPPPDEIAALDDALARWTTAIVHLDPRQLAAPNDTWPLARALDLDVVLYPIQTCTGCSGIHIGDIDPGQLYPAYSSMYAVVDLKAQSAFAATSHSGSCNTTRMASTFASFTGGFFNLAWSEITIVLQVSWKDISLLLGRWDLNGMRVQALPQCSEKENCN
ncbi:hypothetical protein AURDEDRAFT_128065 [Auricularia subglabra TFB-10046 SS5]|nr:hypothetical protein AURDEDRAFT_128065 [Auricularia subglabra TFB-10046 SS5]